MKTVTGLACLVILLASLNFVAGAAFAAPGSGPGGPPPADENRALCLSEVPGYPVRDNSMVHWRQPGEDLPDSPPASSPTSENNAQFETTDITGVALYRHAITGEFIPCAGMTVLLVYESSYDWWDDMDIAIAGVDGSFTLTTYSDLWHECESYKVVCVAQNEAANPDVDFPFDGYGEYDKYWETDAFVACGAGDDQDLGYVVPQSESSNTDAHVAMMTLRNRVLMQYLTGDLVAPVNIIMDHTGVSPDYDSNEYMYVDWDTAWSDGRLAAQYARLWMAQFCATWDDPCGDGRECSEWCPETAQTAYTQGLARWFGDIVPRRYGIYYDYISESPYDYEDPERCDTAYADPNLTPGFFAAVLRDIQDAHSDLHEDYGSQYADALALDYEDIVWAAKSSAHADPLHFLRWMRDADSSIREDLWQTAINCGYDIDETPPGVVTGLTSSHTVGAPSPDATITFNWSAPEDDASGIAGYSVAVASHVPSPDEVQDIGATTTYTTVNVAPGDWYFTIRAVDRSGRWSASYATAGPFTIVQGDPADLEPYARTGWDYPVVPRTASNSSAVSCPSPTTLTGGAGPLYFNACGTNSGESVTAAGFGLRCLVDGEDWGVAWGHDAVDAGEDYWLLNRNIPAIGGGRHTFEGFHDSGETLAEPDETNNRWAKQWIWSPPVLTPGAPVVHAAPPDPEGGWDALPSSAIPFRNCDGYRFASGADWRIVWVQALDPEDDYDLRLHSASTGPAAGFALWSAEADRNAGQLDALLVNGHAAGAADWDVGVSNVGRLEGAGDYSLTLATGAAFSFGDSLTFIQDEGEQLLLLEVPIAPEDVGWVTVAVDVRPATQRVRLFWFDSTFEKGDLLDRTLATITDAAGHARGTLEVAQSGSCGLVVLRDPLDGAAPDTLTIEVQPALPNLRPIQLANWYSPLVPRPAPDGAVGGVEMPDTLHGNQALTWYNAAVINDTPAAIPTAQRQILVDGVSYRMIEDFGVPGYSILASNLVDANTVRGGRHTLSLYCDKQNLVEEIKETDNIWAEQFVWSPLVLSFGTPVIRSAPPDPHGGWIHLPVDTTRYYNCDGLRSPAGAGHFAGVAVMPGDACDVDVRLHQPAVGAKLGFDEVLAQGHWGTGLSEYVLANLDLVGAQPFDAGVVFFGGRSPYVAEAVDAVTLAFDGEDVYGPFTLSGGRILDLYALPLPAGYLSIALENLAGTVDWELRLHPADLPYVSKSDKVDSLQTLGGGPGEGETLQIEIPDDGWYCLAVGKAGSADLALAGEYRLTVGSGLSGVHDGTPPAASRSALVAIQPNPFNPSTRLVLDVAAPGRVRLEVFDARGRRVRGLVDEALSAGRKEVVWDGRDDAGRALSSGTYFARFTAGEVAQTQKMTLVK